MIRIRVTTQGKGYWAKTVDRIAGETTIILTKDKKAAKTYEDRSKARKGLETVRRVFSGAKLLVDKEG